MAAWVFVVLVGALAANGDTAIQPSLSPHPRLRLTASRVSELRTVLRSDQRAQQLWANLTKHAAYLVGSPLPPNGSSLVCDVIRDHMYTLGIVYHMTDNSTLKATLAARASAELLLVTSLSSWNPKRFLTVAETMHGVAIGYDWFYDELSPPARRHIEDSIATLGLDVGNSCWDANCSWVPGVADTGVCASCWWTKAPMNWNIVSNGALTIGALAIQDVARHTAKAALVLSRAAEGIPIAVAKYASPFWGPDGTGSGPEGGGADGGWPEGPGYWCFVTKYLLAVSESLVSSVGSDNGYMEMAGVKDTAGFGLQMHRTPSGSVFNYGDAEEENLDTPGAYGSSIPTQARYAANLLGLTKRFPHIGLAPSVAARQALFTPDDPTESSFWDETVLALLSWESGGTADDIAALPNSSFFPSHGSAVLRSGWSTHCDMYLGCKGGDSMASHQDLDHGSFVLDAAGYRWAVDLGSEKYQLPNMFLPFEGRYSYYRKSTRGHNTLAFGDPGGFEYSTAAVSDQKVNVFSSVTARLQAGCTDRRCDADGVTAVVNLTDAYSVHLQGAELQRTFRLLGNTTAIVEDAIGANPRMLNVTWALHTRAAVLLNGTQAQLHNEQGVVMQMSFHAEPATAVCGLWQTSDVVLPETPIARFPLRGARKVWFVCQSEVKTLRVILSVV